jgi:hypothetical protein
MIVRTLKVVARAFKVVALALTVIALARAVPRRTKAVRIVAVGVKRAVCCEDLGLFGHEPPVLLGGRARLRVNQRGALGRRREASQAFLERVLLADERVGAAGVGLGAPPAHGAGPTARAHSGKPRHGRKAGEQAERNGRARH